MLTFEEKIKFELLCRETAAEGLDGQGIGTFSEKRMHKTLKRYICPDEECHEIRIKPDGSAAVCGDGEVKKAESGKGGYIADIYYDGKIFEIQTGSFYPMKAKIKFYLDATDFDVTVVHPLIAEKWSVWIDPETGDLTPRRRSPKKERLTDLLPELFWLSEFLDNKRLFFRIPMLEAEEYRLLDGWSRDRKKGAGRYERIPIGLIDEVCFRADEIVPAVMSEILPDEFGSSELSKLLRLKGRKLSASIKLLVTMGVIERGEKKGKSFVYRRIKK